MLNPFAFFITTHDFPFVCPDINSVLLRQEILEQAQDIAQRCREHQGTLILQFAEAIPDAPCMEMYGIFANNIQQSKPINDQNVGK